MAIPTIVFIAVLRANTFRIHAKTCGPGSAFLPVAPSIEPSVLGAKQRQMLLVDSAEKPSPFRTLRKI